MPSEKPYDEMSDLELMDLQADAYRAIIHDDVSAQDPEYDIFDNIAVILAKRHIDRRERLNDDLETLPVDGLWYAINREFLRFKYDDLTLVQTEDSVYNIRRYVTEIHTRTSR